ncbi:hypothetical protein PISMIDRAFT_11539 [Pisolithus microcarpus 441]|uniref:Uncharacterized protein n=1 Tax=Pisolithus microcarpus 441 TaxID=765257 RepID=A0A0C9ZJ78_9AGAM|nr:hypothetical protein BKA83DRAFT_11539 [Pisolithus microcarpus]KIK22527.1 hypothetical protein PISMIDRAFT_11539 [Pisolithus microcarpus 441]
MPLSPPKLSPMDADEANFFDMSNDVLRILSDKKIGILGAGVGVDSVDVEFEILEASDDVGGRLSTHEFLGARK